MWLPNKQKRAVCFLIVVDTGFYIIDKHLQNPLSVEMCLIIPYHNDWLAKHPWFTKVSKGKGGNTREATPIAVWQSMKQQKGRELPVDSGFQLLSSNTIHKSKMWLWSQTCFRLEIKSKLPANLLYPMNRVHKQGNNIQQVLEITLWLCCGGASVLTNPVIHFCLCVVISVGSGCETSISLKMSSTFFLKEELIWMVPTNALALWRSSL